jgi:hypothetical protein
MNWDVCRAFRTVDQRCLAVHLVLMSGDAEVAVGQRVPVYTGGNQEHVGGIVEDFGDLAGHAVTVGQIRTAEPGRR